MIDNIYFEYNRKTGKVNRISNEGQAIHKEITVKVTNPNWTRLYFITPDKKGEDCSDINIPMTVSNFKLVKNKGKWNIDVDTTITVDNNSI